MHNYTYVVRFLESDVSGVTLSLAFISSFCFVVNQKNKTKTKKKRQFLERGAGRGGGRQAGGQTNRDRDSVFVCVCLSARACVRWGLEANKRPTPLSFFLSFLQSHHDLLLRFSWS